MPSAAISREARPSMRPPSQRIWPERSGCSPHTALSSEVLPAPFGPTMAVMDPRSTRTVAPFTARALP